MLFVYTIIERNLLLLIFYMNQTQIIYMFLGSIILKKLLIDWEMEPEKIKNKKMFLI